MKRAGDLMRELGFREDAAEGTKRAFIENLVRSATGEVWANSINDIYNHGIEAPREPQQLSFDFMSEAPCSLRKSS